MIDVMDEPDIKLRTAAVIGRIDTGRPTFEEGVIAELIGQVVHGRVRYDHDQKCWFVFGEPIWRRRLARVVISTIIKTFLIEVRQTHRNFLSDSARGKLLSHAVLSNVEREMRLVSVLAVTRDMWDRDPYLVAALNGVVDLRTGHLRAGLPGDMITRSLAVEIAPKGTPTPLYDAFLDKATRRNGGVKKFLNQWGGLSLVGEVIYQRFLFIYGLGANGKNTLVDTWSRIAGDYCVRADINMFMQQQHAPHPAGLASIISVPMAIAVEAPDEAAWNMSLLKMVSGEDTLAVRFMRENFFDAKVQCTLTVTGNYKPMLKDVDEAIMRRLTIVHFDYTIPAAERVPRYHDVLFSAEGPAILRKLVDGVVDCLNTTLDIPPAIREASAEYFAEQDAMAQFVEEYCELDNRPRQEQRNDPWVTDAAVLLATWKGFASANRRSSTHSGFKAKLLRTAKNVEWFSDEKGKHYRGIRVKQGFQS